MAYYTKGSGKPLLMINGFLSTMSLSDPALLDRRAKKHQLILFDNRGVGFSTDTRNNNTAIPRMADDAAGLIRKLGYKKVDLVFPYNRVGKQAASECLARIKQAASAGAIPNDFTVSHETSVRQTRARTVLWSWSDANFNALKWIKNPVLLADGRDDVINLPQNSVVIANQIPFTWTAFLEGAHAFLFQSNKEFADLVSAFLQQAQYSLSCWSKMSP